MSPGNTLSIWNLLINASPVVQVVMGLLGLASIASWTLIFSRRSVLSQARRLAQQFESEFWSGGDLQQLYVAAHKNPNPDSGMENLFRAGLKEFMRLREKHVDADAVMQGTLRAMRVALSHEQTRLESSLPFLASVGSTSPYVGLFGTVWGIMTSFLGLANVHQATLATVAPGIAEALVTTAMGLFAAIPAVLAYNRFSAVSDQMMSRYETFADEFSGILHREAYAGHH